MLLRHQETGFDRSGIKIEYDLRNIEAGKTKPFSKRNR